MTIRLASRAAAIQPTLIRQITDQAKPSSLHLGLGQPDLPVPDVVREAVEAQVTAGYAPYSPNLGLPVAREAVARRYGCDASEVMLTVGVQEAMAVAILGAVEPGDDVLVPDPGFPAYANLVRAAGGTPVSYRLAADFGLDVDAIRDAATARTTTVILNSPSNPTGGIAGRAALEELVAWCEQREIGWISDEIYEDFVWTGEHVSPREFSSGSGMVMGGLSKLCSMMGWRLGWLIAAPETIESLKPLHQHLVTCAPTLAQHAAVAALAAHESIADEMRTTFASRRALVLDILGQIPTMEMQPPGGAFYAFPNVAPWCERFGGSLALCQKLLADADVVTIPGVGFGAHGEGHLRIAYTIEDSQLREALTRVAEFLETNQP